MNFNNLIISAIIGVAFLMSGCAGKKLYTKNSGFFKDYEQLNKQIEPKSSKVQSKDSADLSFYKNIIVAPVKVISSIAKEQQTESQKKLYKDISEYLTTKCKEELGNSSKYILVENPSKNTLILESAISAVEVHFDDPQWYQFSSIAIGLTAVSFGVYVDEDVRILGEKRLVDSQTGDVLERSMNIQEDVKITLTGYELEFTNIKPALDSWLKQLKKDFDK